jgi:hypothetical protein
MSNGLEWLTKDFCSTFHFASLVKISCIGLNFVAFVVAADLVSKISFLNVILVIAKLIF